MWLSLDVGAGCHETVWLLYHWIAVCFVRCSGSGDNHCVRNICVRDATNAKHGSGHILAPVSESPELETSWTRGWKPLAIEFRGFEMSNGDDVVRSVGSYASSERDFQADDLVEHINA